MNKVIFGSFLVSLLVLGSPAAFAEPMYGVLMVVKGSVKILNAAKQNTDAKVGGKVLEGDTIITAADSRAKVVMSDRNVINVNPDTQITISKYENDAASGKKNVELNLLKGKVRNNVEQTYDGEKSKFLIKTPTAVAGVRGTQFLAGYDTKTRMTSVVTFKGSVTLASVNPAGKVIGSPVLVKKGEMTQAAPDTMPEPPKAMPKEEIKKMDGDSTAGAPSKEPSAEGTANAASPSGEQMREVANEPAPTAPAMIDSKDVDMGMAKEIRDVRAPTMAPPPTMTPPPYMTPPPLVNEIIRDNTGKTRVNVRPVLPN